MLRQLTAGAYRMVASDLALSRRLERAEGYACARHAEARRRLFPSSGADWMERAGTYAVFDGIDSPITQTFGAGLFEELTPASLEAIESFYRERNAPVFHEVSPYAGIGTLTLLCARHYRPVEISSVLYQAVEEPSDADQNQIRVRIIAPDEAQLWSEISAAAWSHGHPELLGVHLQLSTVSAAREQNLCFLAELNGTPGAAGVLSIHAGVALFAGSATLPELRRRGLQRALLRERMRYAFDYGCDVAMMVAQPGSDSQRNAERQGFHVAYTRIKWRLCSPLSASESRG